MKNEIPVKDGYELYEGPICIPSAKPLIAVSNSGNRYEVTGFKSSCGTFTCWKVAAEERSGIYPVEGELTNYDIDHFEVKKPEPKMPDSPGLWKDKDGDIWVVNDNKTEARSLRTDGFWSSWGCINRLDGGLGHYAPFTRCTLTDENGEEI